MRNRDMGNNQRRAWRIGKIDSTTGMNWDEGAVSRSCTPGINISESIGGDDVSDYLSFTITKTTTLCITTSGAIEQLIKDSAVVVDAEDSYTNDLIVTLSKGTYFLGFSSESSTAEIFNSAIAIIC